MEMDRKLYAYELLRDLAFVNPDTFIQFSKDSLDPNKDNFFRILWKKMELGNVLKEDELVAEFKKLKDGSDLITIKLPAPKRIDEPLFVGMLTNGARRFYTLMLTERDEYSLCCWEQILSPKNQPRYYPLKDKVNPTLETFHKLINELEQ